MRHGGTRMYVGYGAITRGFLMAGPYRVTFLMNFGSFGAGEAWLYNSNNPIGPADVAAIENFAKYRAKLLGGDSQMYGDRVTDVATPRSSYVTGFSAAPVQSGKFPNGDQGAAWLAVGLPAQPFSRRQVWPRLAPQLNFVGPNAG